MKIYVKNMVCDRCKLVVENKLRELEMTPCSVSLGEINIHGRVLNKGQIKHLNAQLLPLGFEVLDNQNSKLVEKVKRLLIHSVQQNKYGAGQRISNYIKKNINYDYKYISRVFSASEGITIESYLIQQRVEKIKELLIYAELSLKEIAYQLGYSSIAHLSTQFKKVTGLSPSQFKQRRDVSKRKPLDKVGIM